MVMDDDRKTFSIEGPMSDDTLWNAAVCRAQATGRHVRCSSSPVNRPREFLRRVCVGRGYSEATDAIVSPSP
jgi:hypothetical protein